LSARSLLCGPFSELEARLFAAIDEEKRADPLAPVDVLVGSNLLAVHLRRGYAERRGAHANLRFLTFLDLAREMLPAGADPRPPMPALGPRQLARRALTETPEAERFGPLRQERAMAAATLRLADELRDAGLVPGALRLLPAEALLPDRAEQLAATAAVLERFEKLRGAFRDAASLLERAAATGTSRGGRLLVYGLHDLGGVRAKLLQRAAATRDVAAFVPEDGAEEDPSLPPARRRLFEELLGVSAGTLTARLAEPSFVLAPSDSDEARETVREALRALDEGTPLHRIGILLRDPARQEPALTAELRRAGVPYFRPAGPGLAQLPLGRAARLLVDVHGGDFPKAPLLELLDLLDAMGLLPSPPEEEESPPGALRRAAEALGVPSGRAAWEARLEAALQRRAPTAALQAFATAFRHLVALAPPAAPAPLDVLAGRLAGAFSSLFQGAPGLDDLQAALVAVAELAACDPAPRALAELSPLLAEALDLAPVAHGRFERDGLSLLSCVSARGLSFDTVLIPGLVENFFPAASAPDPLLLDDERDELRRRTGAPLAPRGGARHAREEAFLFALARQGARRRLVLLASRRDTGSDRTRLPSPFLTALLEERAGRHMTEEELRDGARAAELGVRRPAFLAAGGPPYLDEEELARALQLPEALGERRAAVERAAARGRARRGVTFSEWEGNLGRATPLFDLTGTPFSAGRLERFAGCPYSALLQTALRLPQREDPDRRLTPDYLAAGSLLHGVLRDLAREASARGVPLSRFPERDARDTVERLARREVGRWGETAELDLPPVLLAAARRDLTLAALAVLAYERSRAAPLPIGGAEVRFGRGASPEEDPRLSSARPVEVVEGGATFRLSGRIDRLDLAGKHAHVVDYKLSDPKPYGVQNREARRIAGGERLQLPVYARAARALGAEAISSEYLFVSLKEDPDQPRVTPVSFDEAETREAEALLARFLTLARAEAEAGRFFPFPRSLARPAACGSCGFALVCGAEHEAPYEAKLERLERAGPLPVRSLS